MIYMVCCLLLYIYNKRVTLYPERGIGGNESNGNQLELRASCWGRGWKEGDFDFSVEQKLKGPL